MTEKPSKEEMKKIYSGMEEARKQILNVLENFNYTLPEGKRLKYDCFSAIISAVIADELLNHHALVNRPIYETFLRHVMQDFEAQLDCGNECECKNSGCKAKIMKVDLNSEKGQAALKSILTGLSDS